MIRPAARHSRGFTLVELAIVMIIIALLIGGLLLSAGASRDIAAANDTQKQLASVTDTLIGFAAANGRLPCPASATSSGREAFCTNASGACGTELVVAQAHGRCAAPFDGFLPAGTLGVSPTDAQGYAVDAWGNRIRYGVTQATSGTTEYAFTAANGIRTVWTIDPSTLNPDLRICTTETGKTGTALTANCASGQSLTDNAVAVLLSPGKNGGVTPAAGTDERANWTDSGDRLFVSKATADFDDIVSWIPPYVLYNRMISAGRL